MGLTTPLALLGMVLLGVPIVAHLLRRADVRSLRLPTVALLSRVAVASKRRPRLVDPLLLALRAAAVALAVLALAAPFTERTLAFGDGRLASVVLVIDDSASMSRDEGGAPVLELAVARAEQIIAELPDESEVALVASGSPARVIRPRTADLSSVLAELRSGRLTPGSARGDDLLAALALAERQLAGARHGQRRIVAIGDFRGVDRSRDAGALPLVSTTIERVGGEAPVANVAITAAGVERRDGIARVSFTLRAFGDVPAGPIPVRVMRGATELVAGEVALDGSTAAGVLTLPEVPAEQDPGAVLEIDPPRPDGLRADDRRGLLLRPSSAPRVVLVDRLASGELATRFVERALTLAPREEGGPIAARHVDARSFPALVPGTVDVIVLADVDLREPRLAEAIAAHVEAGAGLLLAPGPHTEPGSESRLASILPARINARAGAIVGLVREPVTPMLPPSTAPDAALALVRAREHAVLEPTEGEVVLRFSDGAPALVANVGQRTAVLAVSLDDAWSDLPYRPVFLPAIVRVVMALSPPGSMPDEPMAAGEVPVLRGPDGARAAVVSRPDGVVATLPGERGVFSLATMDRAGPYAVSFEMADGSVLASPRSAFVLAPPPAESDLTPYTPEVASAAPAAEERAPALVRTSLSPWVFLLVGLLALAEGAVRLRPLDGGASGR